MCVHVHFLIKGKVGYDVLMFFSLLMDRSLRIFYDNFCFFCVFRRLERFVESRFCLNANYENISDEQQRQLEVVPILIC